MSTVNDKITDNLIERYNSPYHIFSRVSDYLPKSWRIIRAKYVFDEVKERSQFGEEELLSVSEYFGIKPRKGIIDLGDHLTRADSLAGYKIVRPNNLVINIMLAWKRGLGISKYYGIASPAYNVFRIIREDIDPDFLDYLLRSNFYITEYKRHSTGVIDSRLRLYPKKFLNIPILLPEYQTQQKIALLLQNKDRTIDELVAQKQKLIELFQEKRQALITHAVTKGLNPTVPMKNSDVEWLGEINEEWDIIKIKYLVSQITNRIDEEEKDEFRYIGLEQIESNSGRLIDSISASEVTGTSYHFQSNDVLFGKLRPYLAKAVIPNFEGVCTTELIVMKPKKVILSQFLLYFILTPIFIQYINASTYGAKMPRTNWDFVGNSRIPVPDTDTQYSIVKYINEKTSKLNRIISKLLDQIKLLEEYRQTLITNVVTGKIDVCGAGN